MDNILLLEIVISILFLYIIISNNESVKYGDACTFYVSPTGSDSNDGLTADTPFKTIQHAVNLCPTTDDTKIDETNPTSLVNTIYLAAGTYNSDNTNILKAINKRINIDGQGNQVTLTSNNTDSATICAFYSSYISFVNFSALYITTYSSMGVESRTGSVIDFDKTISVLQVYNYSTESNIYGFYANSNARLFFDAPIIDCFFDTSITTGNKFGIYINSGSTAGIDSSNIVTNASSTSDSFAIYGARASTVSIYGTSEIPIIINNNWKYGVYARGSNINVTTNYITNNAYYNQYKTAYGGQIFTTDVVDTIATSGSGNAITAISKSGNTVTATKGTTFIHTSGGQKISGTLEMGGQLTMDATINSCNVIPTSDSTMALGSSSKAWKSVYSDGYYSTTHVAAEGSGLIGETVYKDASDSVSVSAGGWGDLSNITLTKGKWVIIYCAQFTGAASTTSQAYRRLYFGTSSTGTSISRQADSGYTKTITVQGVAIYAVTGDSATYYFRGSSGNATTVSDIFLRAIRII